MQNLLEQYKNIKPSPDWIKKTEKELKAVMAPRQWPIYSVIFVLALGLSFGLALFETPEKSIKIIQEQKQTEQKALTQEQTKTEIAKTIKKAKTAAQKIQTHLEEKIMASKIKSAQGDEVDARIKLLEDLDKIKATGVALEEIEKYINQGDDVIAREKLNQLLENLDSLKVDSEKRNDNN